MKRNVILALSAAMILSTASMTFAETNTVNKSMKFEQGERPAKPENEIIGKITSIDATNVTIEVVTRKERAERPAMSDRSERPERFDGNNGMPPEKPEGDTNGMPPEMPEGATNGMPPQFKGGKRGTPSELGKGGFGKGNFDERNIEDMFTLTGEKKTINIASADFNDNFKRNNDNTENTTKTYKDFSVGDYVMIEATDNTYSTAKKIREIGKRGFGGMNKDNPPKDNNIQ